MKALKSFGKRKKRVTLILAVTALCASFFPVTSSAGAPAASEVVTTVAAGSPLINRDGDTGIDAIALGYTAVASGADPIALGKNASAKEAFSVAVGNAAVAFKSHSVAIGSPALAKWEKGAAGAGYLAGSDASNVFVSTQNAIAIGDGEVSKGVIATRQLTGLAAGTEDTDAVNVGQLKKAMAGATEDVNDITMNVKDAFMKATETRSFKDAGLVPGKSESSLSTAIGNIGFGKPSIGKDSSMSVTVGDAVQVGNDAERSTAIGYNSKVAEGAEYSVALGESSAVTKKESIAIGKSAKVETQNAIAIGTSASIQKGAVNSIAIGGLYSYSKEDGLGGGASYMVAANAKNSTVIGTGTLSQSEGATALGEGAWVTEGAAGSVALGQGSSVGSADIFGSDTYGVVSVGSTQGENGEAVTRRVINVADGVNAHDAANMSQLNSVRSSVYTLGKEIDSVGAISSALAGLHPIDYDGTGSKLQISAAAGTYDGKQAVALGAFYHANRDVMLSIGASSTFGDDRKTAGNIGVTFRVGDGADETVFGQSNRERDMERLRAEIEQLRNEIEALKAK